MLFPFVPHSTTKVKSLCALPASPSRRRKPIVHKQMRPVHEARLVAGQEQGGLGDLHRFADAALGGGDGGL